MTLNEIKVQAMYCGFKGNVSHINQLVRKVHKDPKDVYRLMNVYGINTDSIVREYIFRYIADKHYNGDYTKVYNKWLSI